MKRLFVFFACLICVSHVYAADSTVDTTSVEGIQKQILEELSAIKKIQDSTYNQRIRAVEFRNKVKKDLADTIPSDYSILSGIEKNTDSDFVFDSWNLYGILALILSCVALYYTWKQWESQRKTEKNTEESEKHTKNAPISVQKGKLADLPRHFYRNIVCSCAAIFKHIDPDNGVSGNRKYYPSESNLLKLKTLPDDIFLPIDIDKDSYANMHELRLLFRNYNMEVKVASEHLSRRHLTDDSLEQDFDNLLFKPLFLTRKTFPYEKQLSPEISDQNRRAVEVIVNEHFKKLRTNLAVLLKPEINSNLKLLLDSDCKYIKKQMDKKGALGRSMDNISKIHVVKKEFIDICKGDTQKETEALKKFIKALTEKDFIKWFNENYEVKDERATLTVENISESLKPYLDYISQGDWDFEKLFYYMLAVDVAIETDRIGMINY